MTRGESSDPSLGATQAVLPVILGVLYHNTHVLRVHVLTKGTMDEML